ncbi:MAG TPA: hypothetical protein VK859_05045, partial [bacterium]|nr:hypothetical protein [bacterium]
MTKLFSLFLTILLLASCRAGKDGGRPSPSQVKDPAGAEEALEEKDLREFHRQDQKDELYKITDNSFFGPRLSPLAGKPVLLAAGVRLWKDPHSDNDDAPNLVRFEIVEGKGSLEFFQDYEPGQPPPARGQMELEAAAMGGCEAFAWLWTDPGQPEEVVVRASFLAEGKRAVFIDPQSEVLFRVKTVESPAEFHPLGALQLKKNEYENSIRSYAALVDHFAFTYPTSRGMLSREQFVKFQGPARTVLLGKGPGGTVAEAL